MFRSKGLTCRSRSTEAACIEDDSCSWVSGAGQCLTSYEACEKQVSHMALDVYPQGGVRGGEITPTTKYIDVVFVDKDILEHSLAISTVKIGCDRCYVPWEYLERDGISIIRVYAPEFFSNANPGNILYLEIGLQNCHEHINWPLKMKEADPTPVVWYDRASNPPFVFSVPNPVYTEVIEFCEDQGMKLCSYDEICPNGPYSIPAGDPFGDSIRPYEKSDQWVAIQSSATCRGNNWVQVGCWAGGISCSTCVDHEVVTDESCPDNPPWGRERSTVVYEFQEFGACCPNVVNEPTAAVEWYDFETEFPDEAIVWSDSDDYCTEKGMKLCSLEELCPNGVGSAPVLLDPSVTDDQWVAIEDNELCLGNRWAQIGCWLGDQYGICYPCWEHEAELGCPDWGTTRSTTDLAFQKHGACCPIIPDTEAPSATPTSAPTAGKKGGKKGRRNK